MTHFHRRLSTSSVCTFAWDLPRTMGFWEAAGIESVGVVFGTLRDSGLDGAVDRLRAGGVRVNDVIDLSPYRLDEPGDWPRGNEEMTRLIDTASRLGAACVVISSGAPGTLTWEQAAVAFQEAYEPVAEQAGSRGVRLSFENTSPLRLESGFLTTLRDTTELARQVGAGVCMEVVNCWMERDLDRTIGENVDLFDVVQLSDYVLGTGRTMDRAVPGDGDIPLRRIVGLLEGAGYRGPYELEIIGPRVDQEGLDRATLRGLQALHQLLVSIGALEA